jgi:cbb3-type cytochrome oxidase subunit 3
MRVLFTISMLALIALLWASISTARHIYRARQRHRNSIKSAAAIKMNEQETLKK